MAISALFLHTIVIQIIYYIKKNDNNFFTI